MRKTIIKFLKKIFQKPRVEKTENTPLPTVSDIPDLPQPFGYKTSWLAIETENSEDVLSFLGTEDYIACNWESGIRECNPNFIFISPCVNGYIFVVGLFDCPEIDDRFRNVFYFTSHRIVDYYGWSKYKNGELIRKYLTSDDEILNIGDLTPEELNLKFDLFETSLDEKPEDFDYDKIVYVDEENVIQISKAWGIDTSFENINVSPAIGYICRSNLK